MHNLIQSKLQITLILFFFFIYSDLPVLCIQPLYVNKIICKHTIQWQISLSKCTLVGNSPVIGARSQNRHHFKRKSPLFITPLD